MRYARMSKHEHEHGSTEDKAAASPEAALEREVSSPESVVPHHHHHPAGPDYPHYRVAPGHPFSLAKISPDESEGYTSKTDVEAELERQRRRISDLQMRLYAEQKQSLLIVLQALDTGGKDGTIRRVFEGVNPQGCQVWSFKVPTPEEMAHDFLWRVHSRTPGRGMITIFNRSHYEEVLVVRVKRLAPEAVWQERYEQINNFEKLLAQSHTGIIKFYLHISKEEQKRRLESRLQSPSKYWKFNPEDLSDRALWDEYMKAYEDAVNRCSTAWAPWYVVPANKKWYRNLVIARTIADTLEAMDPRFPPASAGNEKITIPD
jgi:PPK2 family polyphosphate:nucleotide phosphotransferase